MSLKPILNPSAASELAARLRSISEDILSLARDLVAAIDSNPSLPAELEDLGVNRDLIYRLERLGRNQIHRDLVFATSPGAIALLHQPLSVQEQGLNEGVEVMEHDEATIRRIPVNSLTRDQVRQVFIGDRFRSLAEQRTWIRCKKSQTTKIINSQEQFHVYKDRVTTFAPGTWTKKQILQWLIEMK